MTMTIRLKGLHELSHHFRNRATMAEAERRSLLNKQAARYKSDAKQTEAATWRAAAEYVEMCQLEPLTHDGFQKENNHE
jgi:hypothetical protein